MAVVLFNGTDGSDSTCMKNQTYGMDIETAFFQTEKSDMVAELVAMHQSVSCNGFRTPKILRKRGSTHNHRLYFFRSYRIYLVDRQFFHNLLPRSTYYFTKSTDMLIRFGKRMYSLYLYNNVLWASLQSNATTLTIPCIYILQTTKNHPQWKYFKSLPS
jgi:hypothetical protein